MLANFFREPTVITMSLKLNQFLCDVCEGLSVSDAHLPADAIYFIRFSTGDHAQEIID